MLPWIPYGKPTHSVLGKADDIGEETGTSTRWDRGGRGLAIWGRIGRDRVGKNPLAVTGDALCSRRSEDSCTLSCRISCPTEVSSQVDGEDRILVRVGSYGIPTQKPIRKRPAKAAGWSSRFRPKASARETSPKKCNDLFLNCGGGRKTAALPHREECGRVESADFFGVRIGLGHPRRRDPARTIGGRRWGRRILKRQSIVTVGLDNPALS
jgi:hypothetical protein